MWNTALRTGNPRLSLRRRARVLAIAIIVLALPSWAEPPPARLTLQDRLVAEAERHLGKPYVFGGRDGRRGCGGRCLPGIDCQSLVVFAFERVLGTPWRRFSGYPSVSIRRGELGRPVRGLNRVLRDEVRPALLKKGDVRFFLLEDFNLEADPALLVRDGRRYGTWHVGLVHGVEGGQVSVIHARPGDRVVIEPLESVMFDGLVALRLPRAGL